MRNPTKTLPLTLALLVLAPAAHSQQMIARDAALLSCGQLLEMAKRPDGRYRIADWANGYVTSYNYYSSRPLSPPDEPSAAAFVETYCRNNPLHHLWQAGAVLVQDLGGKQVIHAYKR